MRILTPYEASRADSRALGVEPEDSDVLLSETDFITYFDAFVKKYREVIEQFFPTLGQFLSFYVNFPFETIVIRSGPSGYICLRRSAETSSFSFKEWGDWPPGVVTLFEIQDYFQAPFTEFNFRFRNHTAFDGEVAGARAALTDALSVFWHFVEQEQFSVICDQLLLAEGIESADDAPKEFLADRFGVLLLPEPGGFRREENWAFRFQHSPRVSAREIREAEKEVENQTNVDVLCLLTPSDVTSLGHYISIQSQRVRIWDRGVLDILINRHHESFSDFFKAYPVAIKQLGEEFGLRQSRHYEELRIQLSECPPGHAHFAKYEEICIRILTYLFSHTLSKPHPQRSSVDGVHRRDVVFRNLQGSAFFRRTAQRFGSDFMIVDCKNSEKPLRGDVLDKVAKYANNALGRFILIVSRKGLAPSAPKTQVRVFRDREVVLLAINDEQLLEMVARKEKGEAPEDVLEDLLDELLLQF